MHWHKFLMCRNVLTKLSMTCWRKDQTMFSNIFFQVTNKLNTKDFSSTQQPSLVHFHTEKIDSRKLSEVLQIEEDDTKLKSLIEDVKVIVSRKRLYPEFLNSKQIRSLFNVETRTQRIKLLHFLHKKEKLKISDALKRKIKSEERKNKCYEKEVFEEDDERISGNRLCVNIRNKSMNKFYNKRLANAALFGNKIVLDLDYDAYMTEKEQKAAVLQLKYLYSQNRKDNYPFDIYFCNVKNECNTVQYLKEQMTNIDTSFISVTEKSYLDIFPAENLVYLSPHATETLKSYDHKAVYIIGSFVDTVKQEKISATKAEKECIKSYSLPLDDYIMWGLGSKCLTINQVFEIMLTLKNTGDWIKAFESIPQRKIKKFEKEQIFADDVKTKIYLMNTS